MLVPIIIPWTEFNVIDRHGVTLTYVIICAYVTSCINKTGELSLVHVVQYIVFRRKSDSGALVNVKLQEIDDILKILYK
jgi:hypothetical protein